MRFGCLAQAFIFMLQMVAVTMIYIALGLVIPGQQLPLVVVLLLVFVIILLHELGHLIAGLLTNHRLMRIQVGPLFFEDDPQKEKPRVGFKPLIGTGIGGFVMMLPRGFSNLRVRMLLVVMGGPAASVLTGSVALALAGLLLWANLPPIVAYALGLFGLISITMGFINLVPLRTLTFQTDGGQLLPLLAGGKHADYHVARRAISTMELLGTRARDLPPELVKQMLVLQNKSLNHINGLMTAYRHFEDANRFEEAGKFLTNALELAKRQPKRAVQVVYIEAAYFWAFYHRDAETARALFSKVKKRILPPASKHLFEAVIALAEGDYETATLAARASLAELDKVPPTAQVESVRKTANDILEAALTEGQPTSG